MRYGAAVVAGHDQGDWVNNGGSSGLHEQRRYLTRKSKTLLQGAKQFKATKKKEGRDFWERPLKEGERGAVKKKGTKEGEEERKKRKLNKERCMRSRCHKGQRKGRRGARFFPTARATAQAGTQVHTSTIRNF
ncbi:hypothetical protein PPACK8108_LOCUS13349 [Phakopsora pachyrhizi]|uniref:Uncharacterized protein n=1 Tax=Phakopsora pachyrhizi TaxID=170000 RepID=A0AAV0B6G3_PHAPC|nr:hypothetical protein PPACK8108_LOCUS13349 [Phakopsora pachyrhizi]